MCKKIIIVSEDTKKASEVIQMLSDDKFPTTKCCNYIKTFSTPKGNGDIIYSYDEFKSLFESQSYIYINNICSEGREYSGVSLYDYNENEILLINLDTYSKILSKYINNNIVIWIDSKRRNNKIDSSLIQDIMCNNEFVYFNDKDDSERIASIASILYKCSSADDDLSNNVKTIIYKYFN